MRCPAYPESHCKLVIFIRVGLVDPSLQSELSPLSLPTLLTGSISGVRSSEGAPVNLLDDKQPRNLLWASSTNRDRKRPISDPMTIGIETAIASDLTITDLTGVMSLTRPFLLDL